MQSVVTLNVIMLSAVDQLELFCPQIEHYISSLLGTRKLCIN